MEQDKEILREIPDSDVPLLLEDLKADIPNSVHAFSFVSTLMRLKTVCPEWICKILAPNGDFRTRCMVYYCYFPWGEVNGSIHKWPQGNVQSDEVMTKALRQSKLIPWTANVTLLTCMTPEVERVIIPIVIEKWGGEGKDWETRYIETAYWIPEIDAKKLTVEPPKGTSLRHLTVSHAKEIDDLWPFRSSNSILLIEALIKVNFGVGLFNNDTNELMSWALFWSYGGVGGFQTKEQHRRKGYGEVVLKAITKEVASKGMDVHLNVLDDNKASLSLIRKLGYRVAYPSTWLYKEQPSES